MVILREIGFVRVRQVKIVTRQHIPDACEDEDPCIHNDFIGDDDLEIWEKVVDGTWAPFKMVANLDCNR